MRQFSSYGPIDPARHYHAPRESLIQHGLTALVGEKPEQGGHYLTVWGPRQTGKTGIMHQILWQIQGDERFHGVKVELQTVGHDFVETIQYITERIGQTLKKALPAPETVTQFEQLFIPSHLDKPLILILDEFDNLSDAVISQIVQAFRNIYIARQRQVSRPSQTRDYLLHGLALVGVRAVLGVENQQGSPFNVQQSMHIPNLTQAEVAAMFAWYQQESGQAIDAPVVRRIFYETQGQPGLTCWLGELIANAQTATQSADEANTPFTTAQFEQVYDRALYLLPNNNILNIVSKAKVKPYKPVVLNLFRTDEKVPFRYDDPLINYLYLNGVVDYEQNEGYHLKFPCPFVQRRLFNYFAADLFPEVGQLYDPFEDLSNTITPTSLNIEHLLRRYGLYLEANRDWLLKDVPRRADLRIYEAVYHFNLYMYLVSFLKNKKGRVYPEFPTGNGKIDLIITHHGKTYGIEVKSFTDKFGYDEALEQAAKYGKKLGLAEITLAFFVEMIDESNRQKYETPYQSPNAQVVVQPIFVVIGSRY